MSFYPGRRLAFDGHLCTVRYVGPLEKTEGTWLGVEWDDSSRGKHDGTYKGQRVFTCRSRAKTPASFIRPTRTPDRTRTVLEAIKFKYDQTQHVNGNMDGPGYQIIEISKKKVQEVGFDKIQKQMSQLGNLRIALVDSLGVVGLTQTNTDGDELRAASDHLVQTCPNIAELDLGWNLFETWQDVLTSCAPLEKMHVLKGNGLRLRSLTSEQQLSNIMELHLNECLLEPSEVLDLLTFDGRPVLPNLKTLWLSQNELETFWVDRPSQVFHSIRSLVLENNKFTSLADVATVCRHFPNVETLSLQGNLIASTGSSTLLSSTLKSLNLASNSITDFAFIDALPALFPNLQALRISRNPLYDQLAYAPPSTTSDTTSNIDRASKPSDAPFYLTLARIPNLQTLNYTTITARDREEGEIYYLSLADKDIRATLARQTTIQKDELVAALTTKYPLYAHLAAKYERPNLFTLSVNDPSLLQQSTAANIDFAANASLAARLVTAIFYVASPASEPAHDHSPRKQPPSPSPSPARLTDNTQATPFTRPLPRSTPVYTLKALLARYFDLPPLRFKLVYESEELDPEQVTTTKLWGGSREEWEEWGRWDVDVVGEAAKDSSGEDRQGGDDDGEQRDGAAKEQDKGVWIDDGKVLSRGGTRWRKREVEILDGMRGWGDYLDGEVREVRVRVEPFVLIEKAGER